MQITLNVAALTVREMSGVLALFASVCPDVLEKAISDLSDGSSLTDAARVFASAPMPDLPGHDGEEVAETTTTAAAPPPPPAAPAAAPAPPPPAPAPAAAAPVVAPAGVTLDKEGLPWDARIHATIEGGGGKITKDGLWRAKRGVSADAKAAVVAELKAALAAAPAPAAAPVAPVPPPPSAEPVAAPPPPSAPASPAPSAEPAPSAPPPPAAPVAPAPAPAAPAADAGAAPLPAQLFAGIMGKVTAAQTGGKITAEEVTALLAGLGLAQLRDLLTRPDLIPAFEASVDAMIGA